MEGGEGIFCCVVCVGKSDQLLLSIGTIEVERGHSLVPCMCGSERMVRKTLTVQQIFIFLCLGEPLFLYSLII